MPDCIIKFKNLTSAQSAQRLLNGVGIFTQIVHLGEGNFGCGFGLSVNCNNIYAAKSVLSRYGISFSN